MLTLFNLVSPVFKSDCKARKLLHCVSVDENFFLLYGVLHSIMTGQMSVSIHKIFNF